MAEEFKGQCLCGAVQMVGKGQPEIEVCHCGMCQHWHGGPAMVANFSGGVQIVSGEGNIAIYESSDWAERQFCKTCGSTLFYRFKSSETYHSGLAGMFELPKGLAVHEHIYVDEQPDYYAFNDTAPRLTGEEVVQRFLESQNEKPN